MSKESEGEGDLNEQNIKIRKKNREGREKENGMRSKQKLKKRKAVGKHMRQVKKKIQE